MKPPGGNYKPNKMNIGKLPDRTAEAGDAAAQDGGYTTAKVMTASPGELILLMYEQFFELIPDIKRSIDRKSQAAMEPDAERAQAIIDELINALDFGVDISADIGAIYFYVRNKIMEANVRLDKSAWDHIESIMRPLYDGFKQANAQIGQDRRQADLPLESPSIVAGITYGQSSLREIVVNTKAGLRV